MQTCPNCGHCPTCGRSNGWGVYLVSPPIYPWSPLPLPYQPSYPWIYEPTSQPFVTYQPGNVTYQPGNVTYQPANS